MKEEKIDIAKLSRDELINELKKRNLPTTGLRNALVQRLTDATNTSKIEEDPKTDISDCESTDKEDESSSKLEKTDTDPIINITPAKNFDDMTREELIQELQKRGLPTTGLRVVLLKRLKGESGDSNSTLNKTESTQPIAPSKTASNASLAATATNSNNNNNKVSTGGNAPRKQIVPKIVEEEEDEEEEEEEIPKKSKKVIKKEEPKKSNGKKVPEKKTVKKKVEEEDEEEEEEEEEEEKPKKSKKVIKKEESKKSTAKKVPEKKTVKKKVEEEEEDEDEEEEEEEEEVIDKKKWIDVNDGIIDSKKKKIVVWKWANDSSKGSQDTWEIYDKRMAKKLEDAFGAKKSRLRVDTERYVDLSSKPYFQRRFDDASKRRLVARSEFDLATKPKKITRKVDDDEEEEEKEDEDEEEEEEEEEKPKKKTTTKNNNNNKKTAPKKKKEEDEEDEEEEEEEEDKKKKKEEPLKAEWFWAGDSPNGGHQDIWVRYDDTMCRNLEKSFQANQESYKVDSERFVDLKNMLQRRYDDIMKRRSIKRKLIAVVAPPPPAPSASKSTKRKRDSDSEEDEDEQPQKKVKTDDNGSSNSINNNNNNDEEDHSHVISALAKQYSFPLSWTNHPSMDMKEEAVPKQSKEFIDLAATFAKTVANYHKNNTQNHSIPFTKLEISRIIRIQNPLLWIRYKQRRDMILNEIKGKQIKISPEAFTAPATEPAVNEYLLYHGLNENFITGITKFGFDPRFCSLKGMFGAGLYFADNSSKANQYCHGGSCTASGFLTGRAQCRCKQSEEACMLMCRVTLGEAFIEKKYRGNYKEGDYWFGRRTEVPKEDGKGYYHSVMGESRANGGSALELREFVVYESSQVYPEYVVYYHRKK